MEIELQKISNVVIISNDTIIGNESAGTKKVSPRKLIFLLIAKCGRNFCVGFDV